jgi:hypothetical protein
MSVNSIRYMVSFSFRMFLLIFCLDDLSIADIQVLKLPTTTVMGSTCGFKLSSTY